MRPLRRSVMVTALLLIPANALAVGASIGTSGASAAGFGYGAPAFENSAAPASFLNSANAGEPSLGVNWHTGAAFFQAASDTYEINFNDAVTPPGISWSDVSSHAAAPNLDPILATDHATGVTLAGGDDGPCAVLMRTTNDGASWTPTVPCAIAYDHPTVAVGPFATPAPVGSSGVAAYFCQQGIVDVCARSLDGGTTWSPGVSQTGCGSLFGHAKVAADGTVYVPNKSCATGTGNFLVQFSGTFNVGGEVSTDNGLTWKSYTISGAPAAPGFDPSVGTTPDGTVYESWTGAGNYHPMIAWSHDQGKTWSPQVDLAGTMSPTLVASTFQAVVTGDNGRVAVAHLATSAGAVGADPFSKGFHGVWYLYVSTSYDGGANWTTTQATPTPVQRGEIDAGGTTTSGQRNLLDFMDANLTSSGRVVVAYANGCLISTGCAGPAGTEAQSTSAYATVAYQSTGKGLIASRDTTPAP